MNEPPGGRCGYTWPDEYGSTDGDTVVARANSCYRETYGDCDRCLWHASPADVEQYEKPVEKLRETLAVEGCDRNRDSDRNRDRRRCSPVVAVTGAKLGEVELGDAISFEGVSLRGATLNDADLSGADMRGADLVNADLTGADLSGSDLSGADLSGADLRDSDLTNADLRGADLADANLSGAMLSDADLREACLTGADLPDGDLSSTMLDESISSDRDPESIEDDEFGTFQPDPDLDAFVTETTWDETTVELFLGASTDEENEIESALDVARSLWADQSTWADRIGRAAGEWAVERDWGLADPLTPDTFAESLTVYSVWVFPDGRFDFDHDDGLLESGHGIHVTGNLTDGPTEILFEG